MALDPGGTTGVALRMSDGSLLTATCSTPEEVFDLVASCASTNTHIVYERFNATRIDRHGLNTVRIIGGIIALCHVLKIPVTAHMPQGRRPFLDIAKKLLANEYTVIHEQDATAHLLAWEYENEVDIKWR